MQLFASQHVSAIGDLTTGDPTVPEVPDVVEKLISFYIGKRDSEAERFVDTVHRLGIEPFKEAVYGNADQRAARRREPALAA